MSDLPILFFATESDWEQWLEENHSLQQGLWLKIAKKAATDTSVSYAEALDIALRYGWIDGQKDKFDDDYWLQKFTRRRKRSPWSLKNRERAVELIAEGKMKPSGLEEIELAKADGRWDQAYSSQSKIEIPDDFQSELDKNPEALAFFNQLNSANRYAFLYRITTAKKADTRQKRIEKFIAMLNAQEKLH